MARNMLLVSFVATALTLAPALGMAQDGSAETVRWSPSGTSELAQVPLPAECQAMDLEIDDKCYADGKWWIVTAIVGGVIIGIIAASGSSGNGGKKTTTTTTTTATTTATSTATSTAP